MTKQILRVPFECRLWQDHTTPKMVSSSRKINLGDDQIHFVATNGGKTSGYVLLDLASIIKKSIILEGVVKKIIRQEDVRKRIAEVTMWLALQKMTMGSLCLKWKEVRIPENTIWRITSRIGIRWDVLSDVEELTHEDVVSVEKKYENIHKSNKRKSIAKVVNLQNKKELTPGASFSNSWVAFEQIRDRLYPGVSDEDFACIFSEFVESESCYYGCVPYIESVSGIQIPGTCRREDIWSKNTIHPSRTYVWRNVIKSIVSMRNRYTHERKENPNFQSASIILEKIVSAILSHAGERSSK